MAIAYGLSAPSNKNTGGAGLIINLFLAGGCAPIGAGLSSVIESIYNRKDVMNQSLGISITNSCYQCQAIDSLCPECDELKFSRDAYIAHEIVDDGNLQYKHVWSNGDKVISGHDWVGSVTKLVRPYRTSDGSLVEERYEFLDAISLITDRIHDLETSITVLDSEVVCPSCHLLYNKYQANCPTCY